MCDDFGEEASSTDEGALSELMLHDQRRRLIELVHGQVSVHDPNFGCMT